MRFLPSPLQFLGEIVTFLLLTLWGTTLFLIATADKGNWWFVFMGVFLVFVLIYIVWYEAQKWEVW